ncbi:MAG: 5-oxoprolinase subunit PxpB [Bacteroidota bacterium]|nr:5-oxoprolinase subunit PxpB [Bacteroidota bacterium]
MGTPDSYKIFPLGDSAITIDFGNIIDVSINQKVIALFNRLKTIPLQYMIEAVPAYSSLTIYYDPFIFNKMRAKVSTVFDSIKKEIENWLQIESGVTENQTRFMQIPVCYKKEFAPDLEWMAGQKNIPADELIALHTANNYRVYLIGFLPGFAYMGEVDEKIAVGRKSQPRQNVLAGSVGIAGKQTGIYPLSSPGGWQIIGCTPMKLFDVTKEEPVLLKAGDTVQFFSITKEEFLNWQ